MKIALECKDIILEKTLMLFLKDFLVLKKECDFLVCDEKLDINKPQFLINKYSQHLSLPFSKDELLSSLQKFDESLKELALKLAEEKKKILEDRIEKIADEFRKAYQQDIDNAISKLKQTLINAINEKI
ncbi:ornithine carbamoyltransferase [Campylobacter avium]|nr:ornithine carbamoyltransferase [Campylobacter avium]